MYSHSYWLVIFVQPIAAACWRGKGGKLLRILGKKHTIFNEHPVHHFLTSSAKRLFYITLFVRQSTCLSIILIFSFIFNTLTFIINSNNNNNDFYVYFGNTYKSKLSVSFSALFPFASEIKIEMFPLYNML